MPDQTNDAADAAIKAALESVEKLEREQAASGDDELDPDQIEVLKPSDAPPSAAEYDDVTNDTEVLQSVPPHIAAAARAAAESEDADPSLADDDEDAEVVPILEDDAGPKKPDVQGALLQSMIAAKNEALQVLDQTQKEAKSLRERLLRVSAEFENYKKRQTREKEDAIKFANESVLKELLPVLDNFDRAIVGTQAAATTEVDPAQTLQTVIDGVSMVHKQLVEALGRFGVQGFDAEGEPFDPGRHEAVSTRDDASVPEQTVIEEYQRGYFLNERLVRPAMVVVSTGGPKRSAAAKTKQGDAEGADGTDPDSPPDAS